MISSTVKSSLMKTVLMLFFIFFLAVVSAQGADLSGKEGVEWRRVLEAAKKEGKLVISGDPSAEWRKALVDLFQQDYPEIKVEYTGIAGRNFWQRVRQERKLGQKLWDLGAGGTQTAYESKNEGFLEPIRPLLLPENADGSKWIGGMDGLFVDKEHKFIPAYTLYVQHTTFVNRDFIKEAELKSSQQLTDPRFKGKMVLQTPTGGATFSSLGNLAFMYGEDFVRDLLNKQGVVVTDDNRQQMEWLVRGKYPIAVGINNTLLPPYQKQGLGKNIAGLDDKLIPVAVGLGGVQLLKEAPHPNAARVYINWLLSQKIQAQLGKIVFLNSRRIDVPPIDKETAVNPARLSNYRLYATEENMEIANRLLPMIREAMGK